MNGGENKIIEILRRFWVRRPDKADRTRCPDEETLAQFLTGSLMEGTRDRIESHLAVCSYCAQELVVGYKTTETDEVTRVPSRVIERAMALVQDKVVFFDLAVRLIRDSIELISTSGRVVPLLRPIVRTEIKATEANALQVEQEMGPFKVAVEIDVNNAETCRLVANVAEAEGKPAEGVRLTLNSGDREQASLLTRSGVVVFDRIAPGEYIVAVSEAGRLLGKIRLNLMLQR